MSNKLDLLPVLQRMLKHYNLYIDSDDPHTTKAEVEDNAGNLALSVKTLADFGFDDPNTGYIAVTLADIFETKVLDGDRETGKKISQHLEGLVDAILEEKP